MFFVVLVFYAASLDDIAAFDMEGWGVFDLDSDRVLLPGFGHVIVGTRECVFLHVYLLHR